MILAFFSHHEKKKQLVIEGSIDTKVGEGSIFRHSDIHRGQGGTGIRIQLQLKFAVKDTKVNYGPTSNYGKVYESIHKDENDIIRFGRFERMAEALQKPQSLSMNEIYKIDLLRSFLDNQLETMNREVALTT